MSRAGVSKRDRPGAISVAVLADGDLHRELADILAGDGCSVSRFKDVDELLVAESVDGLDAIVLWVNDTLVAPGAVIKPLVCVFEGAPLLVACESIERWEVRAALAAGAAGVVLAGDMRASLGPCLRAVCAGQVCVPRAHRRQVEPPALSSREKQILGLVVMGFMNGQIAERLFLAESTVKSHLSSAFSKLGVRSRNEAVELILNPERGLGMGILALGGDPLETAPATMT
jgi:DNA-binding NarL/FixJ family response regulator